MEREAALAAVAATVEAARCGEYSVLFLMGEAGLGKTSLVARARAAADGVALGWAEGVAAETSLPFGLLSQALVPLRELEALPGLGSAGTPGPAFTSGAAEHLRTSARPAPSCCSSTTCTGATQTPCPCWASFSAASGAPFEDCSNPVKAERVPLRGDEHGCRRSDASVTATGASRDVGSRRTEWRGQLTCLSTNTRRYGGGSPDRGDGKFAISSLVFAVPIA